MGRLLGIDYGEKRIGLAVSDPSGIIATPHSVITWTSLPKAVEEIAALCRKLRIEGVVVGWPLNMDGSEGPATRHVQAFIDKLAARIELPIHKQDERLSSKTANDALIEGGTRRERRKDFVDKLAAQILLQQYLECRNPW